MTATPIESTQCYPQERLFQLVCTSRHDSNTRRIWYAVTAVNTATLAEYPQSYTTKKNRLCCHISRDSNTRRISSVQDPEEYPCTLSKQSRQQHWQNILNAKPKKKNWCCCHICHDSNAGKISSVMHPISDHCLLVKSSDY